jgi:Glyoxalase-like domain
VASVPDLAAATRQLSALGIDRGAVLAASRPTPQGLLQWRISVRDDGQRLFGGALPTLIQWGDTHPSDAMPVSGIALRSFTLNHPDAPELLHALGSLGLSAVPVAPGPAALTVQLDTSLGPRTLRSAI